MIFCSIVLYSYLCPQNYMQYTLDKHMKKDKVNYFLYSSSLFLSMSTKLYFAKPGSRKFCDSGYYDLAHCCIAVLHSTVLNKKYIMRKI